MKKYLIILALVITTIPTITHASFYKIVNAIKYRCKQPQHITSQTKLPSHTDNILREFNYEKYYDTEQINNSFDQSSWYSQRHYALNGNILKTIVEDPEKIDKNLCNAVRANDFNSVEYFLRLGADINSAPVYHAKSLEMVQFLHNRGANIYDNQNEKVNLLHHAINNNSKDNRIIKYALEQGISPFSLNSTGGNLWQSFLYSAGDCPEERLFQRAELLLTLGVSPYHKDNYSKDAFDRLKEIIDSESFFFDPMFGAVRAQADTEELKKATSAQTTKIDKLQKLLQYMKDGQKQHQQNNE